MLPVRLCSAGNVHFPDGTGGCDMCLCKDHKLRGMVHREDLPGALVEDLNPFGEQQTLMAGDENCFAWDDDSAEALACNDINRIPPQIEIDDPIANDPEENAAQLTHTPNPVDTPVPHFHNCAKHVENNLLEKFKFGEHLRDLFRQAVHSWHPLQKLQCFNEIGQICTAAQTYCEDLEQELVFRANSKYPKYEVYTNQPSVFHHSVTSNGWIAVPNNDLCTALFLQHFQNVDQA